jgi:hypothetical protein
LHIRAPLITSDPEENRKFISDVLPDYNRSVEKGSEEMWVSSEQAHLIHPCQNTLEIGSVPTCLESFGMEANAG